MNCDAYDRLKKIGSWLFDNVAVVNNLLKIVSSTEYTKFVLIQSRAA